MCARIIYIRSVSLSQQHVLLSYRIVLILDPRP